jgi:hypothetical protein
LALTFGTLLSSQGADALVLQPSRLSFEAVSPMYTVLRSGRTSRVCPAVSQACDPVCSRSVQREQYTTHGALCRGGPRRGLPSRSMTLCPEASVSLEPAEEPGARTSSGTTPASLVGSPPHPRSSSWSRGRGGRPLGRCPDVWRNAPPPERLPSAGGAGSQAATAARQVDVTRPCRRQATPRGRNWTLTRGPTGLVVFGMQCSHVRWHEPPMTTRSP